MEPYYIVNSYYDTEFISSSDVFFSKTDAIEFKTFLDNSNSFVNRVVYCVFLEEKKPEFKIYSIKNGYLLKCPNNNTYYGMEKMEEGKWDSMQDGWVFSSDCDLEKLTRLGSFSENNISLTPSSKYNLRKRTTLHN